MEVRRIPNWNPNDELYHHGIKGQRWGVRRYQNSDGSLTAAGVKRYGTVENFNRSVTKKGIVQYTKDKRKMKRLRQIREQKKAWENEKERIVNSGDKKAIRQIQHELSDEQIARAVNRIAFNEAVNGTNKSRLEKGAEFINKYADTAANLGRYVDTARKVANLIGDIDSIKQGRINFSERNVPKQNGKNQPNNVVKEVITGVGTDGKKYKETIRRKYD